MNINYGSLIKRIEVNKTMKYMQDELRKKHQELTQILAKYGRYAKFFKDDCEYGIDDGYRLFVEYGAAGHVAINGFNDNPINAVWSAEKQCDEALNSQS